MVYRRRRNEVEDEKEWYAWRKKHSTLVEASGLPEIVLHDLEYWHDFLDHGFLDHHEDASRFSVNDLTIRQQAALLRLLMTGPDLLQTLVGNHLIVSMVEAVEQRYKA